MTTYRLFPGTSGPGLTSYAGNFVCGVNFEVTSWALWFEGYWWWCPAGGDTGAQKFALWQLTNTSEGTVIPAATVTSGTLTAGSWNYVPLSAPVPLSAGVPYAAVTGWSAVHGFPITGAAFGSGDAYAAGISNGPLSAYSAPSGSSAVPFSTPQGMFSTAGTDPSATFPAQGSSGNSNFWIDLQVGSTAPAGYAGPYRLWPNEPLPTNMITDSAANFTLATEFKLSQSCTLGKIWFYSPPGSPALPTECGIFGQSSQALVAGTHNSSPSWSGAAGSGWVSCAYSGVMLAAGSYRVAVANSSGTSGAWNNASVAYFQTGAGSGGISFGPLSAPSLGTADSPGQGSYNAGASLTWPGTFDTGNGPSYWVDLEVTPLAASGPAPLMAGYI